MYDQAKFLELNFKHGAMMNHARHLHDECRNAREEVQFWQRLVNEVRERRVRVDDKELARRENGLSTAQAALSRIQSELDRVNAARDEHGQLMANLRSYIQSQGWQLPPGVTK